MRFLPVACFLSLSRSLFAFSKFPVLTAAWKSAVRWYQVAHPENVKKNIGFIEEPIDWELLREVREIIGEQQRVSWANS